jgi:hypothetical protein
MKHSLLAGFLTITSFTMAQVTPVGDFQNHTDIGNPKIKVLPL